MIFVFMWLFGCERKRKMDKFSFIRVGREREIFPRGLNRGVEYVFPGRFQQKSLEIFPEQPPGRGGRGEFEGIGGGDGANRETEMETGEWV